MTEQILWYIIVLLAGLLGGGAGFGAIIRKNTTPQQNNNSSDLMTDTDVKLTQAAANAVAVATDSFRSEFNNHMETFTRQLETNNKRLSGLEGNIQTLLGACPERHIAINQRFEDLQKQIDSKEPLQ